jgi:hypothetical protein
MIYHLRCYLFLVPAVFLIGCELAVENTTTTSTAALQAQEPA